ncbi:hypothetical protein [Flavobacterium sp. '19STA2R22 D10 B1']|uniref:hypothetical protein n=1 Tax=Flavobacterium aerium TaxID=3037261 RepID=UPI00278C188B|nr:hypothetical protein [Flavobacterium sp. '19STA2R22 D10 B1']
MLVKPTDLKTELYPEIIDIITRTSEEEVIINIQAAEDYAKGYLFKYDLKALFGTATLEPTFIDQSLKKTIKIMASYFLLKKANPGLVIDLFRDDWQLMIGSKDEPGWLENIRAGMINPEWPYKPDDPTTPEDESQINADVRWHSNIKRINSF